MPKVGIIRCQQTEDLCPGKQTLRISFPCPFFDTIKAAVKKKVGPEVQLIDWTH